MITIDDISKAIADAPADRKVETAEKMLNEYKGGDKELIAPDIMSSAILSEDLSRKTPILFD